MANQNIFEKYGIKEVMDVTFSRIEKKEETFESQRTILAGSVLKGALKLQTVYPMDNGVGEEDGFKAYVFVDADIHEGATYNCANPAVSHEYTYAQQAAMKFAKAQNLITKAGTRYVFEDADTMFGNFDFSDNFASGPRSTDKVVVVGLAGKLDENAYDIDEINEELANLQGSFQAKAYDVTYVDYAELVVEDEMGYFVPKYLGYNYVRTQGVGSITFFADAAAYKAQFPNYDSALANATMWGSNTHYSINDAIEALRQKKAVLDSSAEVENGGITSVAGGYKVQNVIPTPGAEDVDDAAALYEYEENGTDIIDPATSEEIKSNYSLADVLDKLTQINAITTTGEITVAYTAGKESNRAIYVGVNGNMDIAKGSYIYLLHNKNASKIALDEDGIFKFNDKKGNTLYYQDKIFKGVEWLALVVVGTDGMIFVADRVGRANVTRTAWMVNESGYVTDNAARKLVAAGLIHTTDITVNDETFEATCTVGSLATHKTLKTVDRYIPVLYLDTLKVSTIEQTADVSYAEGGQGNSRLMAWDFNKQITLTLQDALISPASIALLFGSYEGNDFRKGIKKTTKIDRTEKFAAGKNFIVPAGNSNGIPSEAEMEAVTVYLDPQTMEPYKDGTPIAEDEVILKWSRSIAYEGASLGNTIEVSADTFPGTYRVTGDTYMRPENGTADQKLMFIAPKAKIQANQSISLSADGDPAVFDMNLDLLRPADGKMLKFVQYEVIENTEQGDGSKMVKGTENLDLLETADLFKVKNAGKVDEAFIGADEY